MTKIIAITNQKGGVGKTTTSVNLASALGSRNQKVLLIDFDPQGNATVGSGISKNDLDVTINEVLLNIVPTADATMQTQVNYDLLPANSKLTLAETQLLKVEQREYHLKRALEQLNDAYDFILIDCPPSLNILTVNAMVAARSILIPVQCEYYALEGLASLLATIEKIKTAVNPALKIEGVLRTMYDGRNKLSLEVSEQLLQHFNTRVYNTVIPRNVRLAEAPSHGLPIALYDSSSQGARAYIALAEEILRKYAS